MNNIKKYYGDEAISKIYMKEYLEEVKTHFNEPMLSNGKLVRCVGYFETDEDCYITFKTSDGEIEHNTMVGGYTFLTPLKFQNAWDCATGREGKIEPWNDLRRLDSDLALNGCPPEEEFIVCYGEGYAAAWKGLSEESMRKFLDEPV